jgi:hypothetical protein
MSHLSTERLAALGDEEPTPAEVQHLLACAACARERNAYRTLVAMARAERDAIGIPLTRWESIAGALAAEPVAVRPATSASARGLALEPAPRGRAIRFTRTPLRAAAGLLLVAGGVLAGRVSAGAPALPLDAMSATAARGADVKRVANVPDTIEFSSVEEARATQLRSETLYQQAAAFLAEHDTTAASDGNPEVVKSRLAALDQMISTTRAAMREAPHDPVINGYYLTTVNQREATLRQLNTVLPASLRPNSF